MDRLRLTRLTVRGSGKPDATVDLGGRLAIFSGPSNTGKSYIVDSIDYCLGRSKPPKPVPQAAGYGRLYLEFEVHGDDGVQPYVIQRGFATESAKAILFPGTLEEYEDTAGDSLPVSINPKKPLGTLAGQLLKLSGFDPGVQIIKNGSYETESLGIRTLSRFLLVREDQIIKEASPIRFGGYDKATAEQSAFALILTGEAAADTDNEQAHDQQTDAATRSRVLQRMLDELRGEIKGRELDKQELINEASAVDQDIEATAVVVSESGRELQNLLSAQRAAAIAFHKHKARIQELDGIDERFSLLRDHYKADVERLQFIREGGHFFGQLSATHCWHCGQDVSQGERECHPEDALPDEVVAGCDAEIAKIAPRLSDLEQAVEEIRQERDGQERAQESERGKWAEVSARIEESSKPTAEKAKKHVGELTARRKRIEKSLFLFFELDRLMQQKADADAAAKAKPEKYKPRQSTVRLRQFCEVVEDLLRSWSMPIKHGVQWDAENLDLIIDGHRRVDNGKGYRAVTHAAFTIGLMRHCLANGLPHPGFVILDTPLNPYRDEADDIDDGELPVNVKRHFYLELAKSEVGQVIVMENTDPPVDLAGDYRYTPFVGRKGNGRRGLFPVEGDHLRLVAEG